MPSRRLRRRKNSRPRRPRSQQTRRKTMQGLNRRRVLRGMLNGGAVTLALPLLDCFLNNNGTALADGSAMPIRFATWYWQLGMAKAVFVPKKLGANYDLPEEIACFAPIQQHMNLLTNFTAFR